MPTERKSSSLQSDQKKHVSHTINQEKTGLSNYDDKRFFFNNVESLPFGHYKIAEYVNKV